MYVFLLMPLVYMRFRVPCIWASYGALDMKILFVGAYWVGTGKG